MKKIALALVVHAHQPVGNFDHVFEEAYQKAYSPFVRTLLRHSSIRIGLHFSGCLLEWIEKHHPEFFEEIKELVARGQVELMGGGYFEPILAAIPDPDKTAQITRLRDYLQQHYGVQPQGVWLTERVWRPDLVRPLAQAGVRYVILDDTHFIAAGVDADDLHGTYVTEDLGSQLEVIPSLKTLRYTIPFRDPEETIDILKRGIGQTNILYAAGDDAEKFGIWPGTNELCYKRAWLERFFQAIENASQWLETTTISSFMARHKPLGRVYLPIASYPEMMEWALPPRACKEFKECLEETENIDSGERFRQFLLGGTWHGFLSKYTESNLLHKSMLQVSHRLRKAEAHFPENSEGQGLFKEAQTHLLAAQCNDSYWHGLFGGLYAPHLRSAVLQHLMQAETLLEQLEVEGSPNVFRVSQADFDVDGDEEILFSHPKAGMMVKPLDGGTVPSLRFKPASIELVNSLMRRPEIYHDQIRSAVENQEGLLSDKKVSLDDLLRYDRYGRHCFRTYLFPSSKQWKDFERLDLEEDQDLAAGAWEVATSGSANPIELLRQTRYEFGGTHLDIEARKVLFARASETDVHVECQSLISSNQVNRVPLTLGVELVFNLLAPNAPDRYFLAADERHPLEFCGEIRSARLELVDEWQRVKLVLKARPECRWWIAPIKTVSQSEAGFETVYQGSAILAVWQISPSLSPESRWLGIEIGPVG